MVEYNEFGKDMLKKHGSVQGIKSIGEAIGMPDEVDKKNIQKILYDYERTYPGAIKVAQNYGRIQLYESQITRRAAGKLGPKSLKDKNVVDEVGGRTYDMELPAGLGRQLELYMPTIFRERSHYRWFKQNFPELLLDDSVKQPITRKR